MGYKRTAATSVFALEQRPEEVLIDGRLRGKIEALDRLDDGKARLADLARTGTGPQVLPDNDAQIDDKEKYNHIVNKGNQRSIGKELFHSPQHERRSHENPNKTLSGRPRQSND